MKRRSDGAYDLALDDERRDVLIELLRQLSELIETEPDHPNLTRLSPPAYLDDADAGEELRTSHQAAIAAVIESLGRDQLTEDELWSWIQSINGVRLVIGTRLDIQEDDHGPGLRAVTDPDDRALWAVYDFATTLQHDIVDALNG